MYYQQIVKTAEFIQQQVPDFNPDFGIILGTGLGALVNEIDIIKSINYADIPHFPVSTVEFHQGKLIFGKIGTKHVICMQGRFHFYEGYSMKEVTLPVRIMQQLGVRQLIVSNASGGMNPAFKVGDLMIIQDHISLFMPENPLTGKHISTFGDRFPDMCDPYDLSLISKAEAIAQSLNITVQKGVYVMASGPQLETRAEYKLLRMLGADAVGMSTVPEIIVAHQMGIKCFGMSIITDMGIPETLQKASLDKIIAAASKSEPMMTKIISALIKES
ncbi:purine-nucleoside phosphorylase [Arcicella aquatica]|uniref:Purine nucleoside phosphorylase n=1 Tax=Arcicella aquatica TaxID=217141 RepID=A0ABU5QPL7_9BACT|nr:purine-nucleoside phosphorylase [Arcicella aquatica]MEA5258948.1 purine-nucleoside phosphorylase [Arcicella aquatica]